MSVEGLLSFQGSNCEHVSGASARGAMGAGPLLVGVAISFTLLLLGCSAVPGDREGMSNTPRGVVERFMEYTKDHEIERAASLWDSEERSKGHSEREFRYTKEEIRAMTRLWGEEWRQKRSRAQIQRTTYRGSGIAQVVVGWRVTKQHPDSPPPSTRVTMPLILEKEDGIWRIVDNNPLP